MRYLLDSNIVILSFYPERAEHEVVTKLLAEEVGCYISAVTLVEVLSGSDQEELAKFELLFERLGLVEVDESIARRAGLLRRNSKKTKKSLVADLLIAATAIEKGLQLVTNDKDFKRIEKLKMRGV